MQDWVLPGQLPSAWEERFAHLPRWLQPLLYRRGLDSLEDIERYLNATRIPLADPQALAGIADARDLLLKAKEAGLPVVIYGDYDADGVTGTVLLMSSLRRAGMDVSHYIPDRFDEGYGLNREAVEELWSQGKRLLVTVDCGVRAVDEIALARRLGFTTIVTDHHHPHDELPPADALVNPRLDREGSPFTGMAGVGLAYQLARAIEQRLALPGHEDYLDLVALGTVADLAPLRGQNRALVARGIDRINRQPRLGVAALMRAGGIRPGSVVASTIGYGLGPRLNAAGRMEHADLGVRLLLSADTATADQLAQELDMLNRSRRKETQASLERAEGHLEKEGPMMDHVLFVVDEAFHEGVVGLAASRLADRFHRPVLVGRSQSGIVRGSARSIDGFHITAALEACGDLLLEFGGHAAAAGFQLKESNVDELSTRLNEQAREQLGPDLPPRRVEIDAVVKLRDLDESVLATLEQLEPCGEGNPAPLFAAFDVAVASARKVGARGDHLKMTLMDEGRPFDLIGFGLGEAADSLLSHADVAFHYEWNEFRGIRSPQLNAVDVRPAGTGMVIQTGGT